MKNIFKFFILVCFSFINVLNADDTVSIKLHNSNLVKMVLPPGYCDVSDSEEGKAHLNKLNRFVPENYAQVTFIKCNTDDGYPWGYVATNQQYVPSKIDQTYINSIFSGDMKDITDYVLGEVQSRSKILENKINVDSIFKNTSGQPSILWKDKYLISFGGILSGTDASGDRINQYSTTSVIQHSNTTILIYMYSLEGSGDNIYQYASFFQNFSKSLK
tara:strand:+ start:357 stop:1007 length:651 start_codon:yes stop_codon:yes gene_type:complete